MSISNSNHIDILEMDAASKTGIDDIREILEAAKYHPSTALLMGDILQPLKFL